MHSMTMKPGALNKRPAGPKRRVDVRRAVKHLWNPAEKNGPVVDVTSLYRSAP